MLSIDTFIWLFRLFLSKSETASFSINFDDLRQVIFDAQSDGHISVAEGFEILEAIVTLVMPISPFDEQKGPSSSETLGQSFDTAPPPGDRSGGAT